ncbi:MAG TPA: HAMP domain-containing sensor histidine kinase [Acidothermaceae bacterium]|jgi:two-component system sensor histidine kinase BaeS
MSRRRTGLATRIALVTTLAAAIAVLIAGVVLARVISRAADDTGRKVLSQYASLSVDAADVSRTGRVAVRAQIIALLRTQQVQLVVVQPDGLVTGPGGAVATAGVLTPAEVAELKAGRSFSEVRRLSSGRYYLEGRAITTGAAAGGGVVLVQKVADARSAGSQVGLRLLVALIAGLVVAALTGVLLARRLALPLQHAAGAARRLSTGARDVRLVPEGPAEVAAVAEALNALSSALTTSEGRQREFLLSISHELRTPLTAVKGYAEALADGVVAPAAVEATGHVLLAESSRLERLVSDLLDLARLGAEDFRIDVTRLDLVALVRQAATVWADRCLKEGVEFSLEAPDWAVVVNTDPTRVRQIIDGLAENALRVSPAGRPIVFFVGASGSEAIMQVRDGGPGLTEDDCRVAFDRSALYDRYRGVRRVGTGVGLALVAGLTARLRGRAVAGRSPEGGACFTITLPLEPRG